MGLFKGVNDEYEKRLDDARIWASLQNKSELARAIGSWRESVHKFINGEIHELDTGPMIALFKFKDDGINFEPRKPRSANVVAPLTPRKTQRVRTIKKNRFQSTRPGLLGLMSGPEQEYNEMFEEEVAAVMGRRNQSPMTLANEASAAIVIMLEKKTLPATAKGHFASALALIELGIKACDI